jgi:5-methyltetrahydrofolate--homocysteine methyltransferase
MTIREQLNSIAEERIIILDGAMGSVVQVLNLDEKSYRGSQFADHPTPLKGCCDLLCLTRPGAIGAIHDTYLEAGADIIETCTFNSTSISLSDYGLGYLSYELSMAAAQLARCSVNKFSTDEKPRFVAGSIGPTVKGASLYPDVNNPAKRSICWDELEAAYYDNARGLLDGGVDIFLVETIYDTLNAKAALFAIKRLLNEKGIDVPIMISAAISNESGKLLSGQSLETFCISVFHANPWAIGLNCSFHAKKLLPHVRFLSEIVPCLVCVYPNAGSPNRFGRYDEMPDMMSANIESYFKEGLVNIIGGCCGTTPAHIAEITEKAEKFAPRKTRSDLLYDSFSGLEPCYAINNSIYINDPKNSTNREEFQKCLSNGEYEDAADIARDIIENGESFLNIDINDEKALNAFLDYALMNPYVAKVPFIITSTSMNVIEAGLKRLQGRGLAGPVSLEDGDKEFLRKVRIIGQYGAVAIVPLADKQGQADTKQRKTDIENRINQLLEDNNIPIDSVVLDLEFLPGSPALNI